MKRLTIMSVILVVVILLLAGCEQYATYTPNAGDLTALAEHYDGEDKAMVQETAVARYLTAEAAQAAQAQAQAQIAQLEATRQAAQNQEQRQYLAMTAEAQATAETFRMQVTQQAMSAQATAETFRLQTTQQAALVTQCAQETAQAVAVAATAQAVAIEGTRQTAAIWATQTAEARNWAGTATAEALAREATATAQYKADVATETRQAWEGKTTATAESWQATRQSYGATATRQQEQREEVLAYGRDYGIPIVLLALVVCIGALAAYGLREYKKRPVIYPRNFLGDAEPMAVPVTGGGYTFVDLDRQPGPAITVLPSGQVTAPLLRSPQQEERTTARDQVTDAMTRPKLGSGRRTEAPELPAPPEAPAPGLRSVRVLRRLDQAGHAGFLPPTLIDSLQADWEEG